MKKSILALGAAALFGGLGFAGSAQAVAFFGDAGNDNHGYTAANPQGLPQATGLELNAGGIGHVLFVPYYSGQAGMNTMFNITNTDTVNGKAVKVRFRGAANSDDVMDFTVLLSPGDVWTGSVSNVDGAATLSTPDNSCTLPQNVSAPFNTLRIDTKLTDAARSLHLNEGYIEILNMADIPPGTWTDVVGGTPTYAATANALYATILHNKAGVPTCDQALLNTTLGTLSQAFMGTRQDAFDAGLGAPTGQLMASYAVLTTDIVATYGGSATAIRAVDAAGHNARGNIIYSPQLASPFADVANIRDYTADPLLRNGNIEALWYDLPDMSTPLTVAGAAPYGGATQLNDDVGIGTDALTQVDHWLADALGKTNVINDWIYNPDKNWQTDWVVSQPTRRYYAAVDYTTHGIVWNSDMTGTVVVPSTVVTAAPPVAQNRYGSGVLSVNNTKLVSKNGDDLGTYACMHLSWTGYNREEGSNIQAGTTSLSPGAVTINLNCGEVYTITMGKQWSQVLQAQITNQYMEVGSLGEAGWAYVTLGANLPSVGFSATSAPLNGGNLGYTIPHRWN